MANRVDWYYRQLVSEGDMDGADDRFEQADWDLAADNGLHGIMSGLELAESAIPDLKVTVSGPGWAYDQDGKRIFVAADQEVDVSEDSNAVSTEVLTPGNVKIISVFVKAARTLSNLKVDGNNVDVYYNVDESFEFIVEQSSEGVAPVPPALKADAKLLGDITRSEGDTTITNSMINYDRRQYVFDVSAGSLEVKAGTAEEAIEGVLVALNEHITDAAGAHAASAISYAGGSAWVDGTANPATTVELQLDKIVTDLTATTGAAKVGFTAGGTIAAGTVQAAIAELGTDKGELTGTNSWSGANSWTNVATFASDVNVTAAGVSRTITHKLATTTSSSEVTKHFEVHSTGYMGGPINIDTPPDGCLSVYEVIVMVVRAGSIANTGARRLLFTVRRTGGTVTQVTAVGAEYDSDEHGAEFGTGLPAVSISGTTVRVEADTDTPPANVRMVIRRMSLAA